MVCLKLQSHDSKTLGPRRVKFYSLKPWLFIRLRNYGYTLLVS